MPRTVKGSHKSDVSRVDLHLSTSVDDATLASEESPEGENVKQKLSFKYAGQTLKGAMIGMSCYCGNPTQHL